MKTSTVLIIGGAAVAILFILSRSKSSPLLGKPATSTSSTSSLLAGLGIGAAAGGALGKLFGGSSSSPPINTGSSSIGASSYGSSYAPDTATSNYLADVTAASDDQTGVVGFGGWD